MLVSVYTLASMVNITRFTSEKGGLGWYTYSPCRRIRPNGGLGPVGTGVGSFVRWYTEEDRSVKKEKDVTATVPMDSEE